MRCECASVGVSPITIQEKKVREHQSASSPVFDPLILQELLYHPQSSTLLCIPTKLLHLLVHRAVFPSDGRVAPADSRHNIRRVQSWEWWLRSITKQAALKTASFWAANDSGSHSVWHLKINFAWSCLLRWVSASCYLAQNPKGWAYINWFKLERPI